MHMVHERRGDFVNLSWKGGIHEDLARCRKESVEILEFFTNAESILGPDHLTELDDKSIDISLACALQITEGWSDRTTGPLGIVHDTSSAMAREKWMWDAIVSPKVPSTMVGIAHRKRKYPLRVKKTTFENSKGNLQLQLADALAGATAEWAKGKARKSARRR
jgi:hypothetical protein